MNNSRSLLITPLLSFVLGVGLTTIIGFLTLWFCFFEYPLPWKTINPTSALFNVENFRFSDYESKAELKDALELILPIGMPKNKVDHIFEATGKAQKSLYNMGAAAEANTTRYVYTYKNMRSFFQDWLHPHLSNMNGSHAWRVAIDYDDTLNLKRIIILDPW